MKIGYAACRCCGLEVNVVDMTGRLCPICARGRVEYLSGLQRRYQAAAQAGNHDVARELAGMISEYEQREGVRLKDAPRALLHTV